MYVIYDIWIKLAYLCLDQVLQQPIHWKNINNYFEVTLKKNQRRTWFIVVEHEEELDEPGQLNCLEHLSDEAQLAEVNHEPEGGYVQFQLNCSPDSCTSTFINSALRISGTGQSGPTALLYLLYLSPSTFIQSTYLSKY